MSTTKDVYDNANEALNTLSNLWQTMLQIIQAVSAASASSLTVEPDLASLQKARKEYEVLLASLNQKVQWLEKNKLPEINEQVESEEIKNALKEHDQLQMESARVSDKLKRMLNQSYALQFQMEMLFSSSQDINLN